MEQKTDKPRGILGAASRFFAGAGASRSASNAKKIGSSQSGEYQISRGRVTQVPPENKDIFPSRGKTAGLLSLLNRTYDKYECVDIICDKTPDGRQALNTYVRLANQGFDIEWSNSRTGAKVKKYDAETREFCAKAGKNNASGIDGMVDQFVRSAITRGGMACEVVVNSDATDIEDVVVFDPQNIEEFKWIPEEGRWAAYQRDRYGKRVDLYDGNFFYVPHQPKVGRPEGTLHFEAAISTVTEFYQLLQDSLAVLNRIGYPRYDVKIDIKALYESATPQQKKSPEAFAKCIQDEYDRVEANLGRIGKDNDFIHADCVSTEVIGGGANGSGIDVRAWFETLEPLIPNAFQLTPVLMSRLSSGSYSLGTVEFKIVTDTVDSLRRSYKRLLEEILNIWARVHGYNITANVKLRPIDWEKELDKLTAQLKSMEVQRRAEEYGWIGHDAAATNAMGVEKADNDENKGFFEFLKKFLTKSAPAEGSSSNEDDEDEGDSKPKEGGSAKQDRIVAAAFGPLRNRFGKRK